MGIGRARWARIDRAVIVAVMLLPNPAIIPERRRPVPPRHRCGSQGSIQDSADTAETGEVLAERRGVELGKHLERPLAFDIGISAVTGGMGRGVLNGIARAPFQLVQGWQS
jgi:hypothetical protein